MAIRRHVIAARNTTPEAFSAALAALKVSEVEEVNGWCWAMASVWTTDAQDLVNALVAFEGPCLLTTTEDACRWRLHLRARGLTPFDTVHEFQWIDYVLADSENRSDYSDLEEEWDEPQSTVVELPGFPPMPAQCLEPLSFEDDFFDAYSDVDEDEVTGEEDFGYRETTQLDHIAECYAENSVPLSAAIIGELSQVSEAEIYPRFLALHASHIADALAQFSIPHDRAEVLRILTGENLSNAERESDIGNLWRFLAHLGLGPKFTQALEEFERVETPQALEDPALRIVKAAGKLPLYDVEGGPAQVPLKEILLMARMTSFQENHPEYAVCIRFDDQVDWPAREIPVYATCAPVKKGFGINLSLQGMDVPNMPKARQHLGELFNSLGDGVRLELLAKGQRCKTRLAGRVQGGTWLLEQSSAPLSREDLYWMLDLFRSTEVRGPQTARDESELVAVLHGASHHMVLCNDPPRREGLRLYPGNRREAEVIGGLFFRHRLKERWDFSKIERDIAKKYKEWRAFEEEMARENALPATGTVVYAGQSSRFLEADYKAKSMDKAMRERAKSRREADSAMEALGYGLLGAVVCEKVGGGILRCYANARECTYSTSYLMPYGMAWHDYCTLFEDGTSLTTGNGLSEGSLRSLRILARQSSGATVGEIHKEHLEGVERLVGRGMKPRAIDPTIEGICRAMDAFLIRRLGAEEL